MSKYREVSTNLNFVEREKETEQFWRENHIFEKSMEQRKNDPVYTFYDGPPTANGRPHIGHLQTRAFKDLFPRFQTMKGNLVPRKAGWDTHGLPVELGVEKLLGINGKEQIEHYGIAPFIDKCKESVWEYKGMWEDFSRSVGFWADMDDPYVTYDNSFIESEWWALKQIWEKGLLYKGFKIVPYCPRCGTPLSSHEVAQGYKDVKERSAVAKFRVKGEDAFILAWTTTPWTLPSNVALCVNAGEDYVKVSSKGETYYLARALCDTVLGEGEYEILEEYKGSDLEHKEYEPLFDFVSPKEKCWYVVCDDYVTLTDGTGVVHIAPAFGEDDAKVGRKYGLPLVQLVDGQGKMTAETKWAGTFCKDADTPILQDLEERGLLFSAPKFEHSYPFCWRCDTPLIYYARESWYIKMTDVREELIRNNNTVNWLPESIGKGRFGDWLENLQDWAVSRNRYWGTPLNIWECECGHRHAVGSIQELRELSPNCPENIELHRPYVDEVTITCPHCGKQMKRVPEVIDCWFDSGSMPFAQHHYPFENKELFEQQFPADFISEAVDQTRGWFYTLLAISTLLFHKAPYKNVLVQGLVQDEEGKKMSKSKGNAVEPMEALQKFGADSLRWYFYTNSAPWLPSKFHEKAVIEGQKKFFSTLWNTYAFFVLYANIDEFDPTKYRLDDCKLTVMDRWLLSRLNTTVREVDRNLSAYAVPEAARALQDFVDEMSNWYVRRSRERFWVQGETEDKTAAYMTLYTTLVTVAKLAAPMVPFMSEEIYRNLVCSVDRSAAESVHLCEFPVCEETRIDSALEADMDEVLKVVTLGRAARNLSNRKNRQPLQTLYTDARSDLGELYRHIILQELNVKELSFLSDLSDLIAYTFKPQLRLLGQKYGKQIGEIRTALQNLDGAAAKKELDQTGALKLSLSGGEISLTEEELLIETAQKEGFTSVSDRGLTVALDTNLTEALIEEGFVREIVSKLQSMRKDAGFVVTDHIEVFQSGSKKIEEVLRKNEAAILGDVLGEACHYGELSGYTAEWDVNGEKTSFGVKKI
ncbi:isoleucine--tRNA ligase [Neglectibacter caecimuris]|uniref:isoleucine--tRNA ligase n=1 Tax=Neglectibacter caecimuris TaxID=3093658 RepID=UPI002AC97F90|nr:isoleucine--tRNA ligase [Neglectibacter sp. M00184]